MARKSPKTNPAASSQAAEGRTFQSIEEIRKTYYPKAHAQMVRKRKGAGLGEFSLCEPLSPGAAVGEAQAGI